MADDTFRKLVHDDASEHTLAEHAFRDAPTLAETGWAHVLAGHTSIEEVLRVVQEAEAT